MIPNSFPNEGNSSWGFVVSCMICPESWASACLHVAVLTAHWTTRNCDSGFCPYCTIEARVRTYKSVANMYNNYRQQAHCSYTCTRRRTTHRQRLLFIEMNWVQYTCFVINLMQAGRGPMADLIKSEFWTLDTTGSMNYVVRLKCLLIKYISNNP